MPSIKPGRRRAFRQDPSQFQGGFAINCATNAFSEDLNLGHVAVCCRFQVELANNCIANDCKSTLLTNVSPMTWCCYAAVDVTVVATAAATSAVAAGSTAATAAAAAAADDDDDDDEFSISANAFKA
ncbi:hypothetical protein PoB_002677500 [Plakobranchus ocellatus]|uniref:Uncharacterized protein n=1 Tax=Plakobranchus ocellatus TaxID=259542 RepID=A0AAV4A022_9GAST|nr:hypothetical protein PoB_002677500 [Plakobranchus ocellatus]